MDREKVINIATSILVKKSINLQDGRKNETGTGDQKLTGRAWITGV